MVEGPLAPERKVTFLGGATIDGAPIPYVVVLAAVVTALSFVPFSIALGGGTAFPLAQVVYPLCGILLGPIAGAVAAGIGAGIGIFVAPHTAGTMPIETVIVVMAGAFAAGAIVRGPERTKWWMPPVFLALANFIASSLFAVLVVGVEFRILLASLVTVIVAFALWLLPTRKLFAHWVGSKKLVLVFLGTAFITLLGYTVSTNIGIGYFINPWPNEVWAMLIPIIPVENLFRMIVGAIIGTGIIVGLRAIGLVKAKWATY